MNLFDDHRISPEHLKRKAVVYVRQSTPDQVRSKVESTRIQIGLREKAITLGWNNPLVLHDDLGISAGGFADRPAFQHMLAQVVMRAIGIIFCTDASRLSRNSKDWASLFELCGHFETLIADLDQVYDLSVPNDRLVLGIKGTVSELELSIIKTRLKMGAAAKAARGELRFVVPPGYGHDPDGRIILDPDRRVQQAIHAMFDQFDRCQTIRQLSLWYRDRKARFPIRKLRKPCTTAWEVPSASTLRTLLKHPIYTGTYVYGRSKQRVEYAEGRLVKRTETGLPPERWQVCIRDNHPAYISWERFLANQAKIAESRPRWTMVDNRCSIRDGLALLTGLLRCGHCGKKVHVYYKNNPPSAMYYCDGKILKEGTKRCLSFGSKLVDQGVSEELCRAVSPVAIDAARLAVERKHRARNQAAEQARLRLQAAQYEADRAFEQFDLVDPKNRLVADTLEERLNQKLAEVQVAREHLEQMLADEEPLTEEQHECLQELSRDFPRLWDHPQADPALKKQLLRTAIYEIIVKHQPEHQRVELTIHWQGGAHTQLHVKKRATPVGSRTEPSLIDTVRNLAGLSDAEIARILNMKGVTTPRNLRWSQERVQAFRRTHRIKAVPCPDDERYMTGQQVIERLGISRNGVIGLLRVGALHNFQVTDFAPWRIPRSEVESETVKKMVKTLKKTGRLPSNGGCPENQISLPPEIIRK
jgi:DNA invertase Pin-like site-specific DNA recombinase